MDCSLELFRWNRSLLNATILRIHTEMNSKIEFCRCRFRSKVFLFACALFMNKAARPRRKNLLGLLGKFPVFESTSVYRIRSCTKTMCRRFLGLFWPIFDPSLWGQYTSCRYGPHNLESKSSSKEPENRLTSGFSTAS